MKKYFFWICLLFIGSNLGIKNVFAEEPVTGSIGYEEVEKSQSSNVERLDLESSRENFGGLSDNFDYNAREDQALTSTNHSVPTLSEREDQALTSTNHSVPILSEREDQTLTSTNHSAPTLWDMQWDIQMVTDSGNAYSYLSPGENKVQIAVIDSGVNVDEFDFDRNNFSIMKNYVPQYDNTKEVESDITDKIGHGTAVVSQIIGNKDLQGIYPFAQINIYRVFDTRPAKTEWIIQAIRDAVDDGNDIINLSLGKYLMLSGEYDEGGNDYDEYHLYEDALRYAFEKGVTVVAAVGNDSLDLDDSNELLDFFIKGNNVKILGSVVDVFSSIPTVINVGGIDINGKRSDFSNFSRNIIYSPAGTTTHFTSLEYSEFLLSGYPLSDWIITAGKSDYQFLYGNSLAAAKVTGMLAAYIDKYNLHKKSSLTISQILPLATEIDGLNVLLMSNLIRNEIRTYVHVFQTSTNGYQNGYLGDNGSNKAGNAKSLLKTQFTINNVVKSRVTDKVCLPNLGMDTDSYDINSAIILIWSVSITVILNIDRLRLKEYN